MHVLADILGTKDLIAVLAILGFGLAMLVFGRRFSLSVKGVTASVDAVARRAEDVARKVEEAHSDIKQTVGEVNGNGDLMRMVARVLAQQDEQYALVRQVLAWQNEHEDLDETRIRDVLNRIVELSQYSHDGVHEMRNLLTPLKGHVDLMWGDWAKQHDIEEEQQ